MNIPYTSPVTINTYRLAFTIDGSWCIKRDEQTLIGRYEWHDEALRAMHEQILLDDCEALRSRIVARLAECGPQTLAAILAQIEPS